MTPVPPPCVAACPAVVAGVASPAGRARADTGAVAGVVYDSLFGAGPLAGAEVWVEGTAVTARADAKGRFRVTGLPAGRHRVTFFHPAYEAHGLTPPVRAVAVAAGAAVEVVFASPSPATVRRAVCGVEADAGAALLGRLTTASGRAYSANGAGAPPTVVAQWRTVGLTSAGVASVERLVTAAVHADGVFRLCGLPRDGVVTLRAGDGRVASVAAASLGGRELGVVTLPVPDAPAVGGGAPAEVVGTARTPGGGPARVRVTLVQHAAPADSARPVSSGDDGAFRLPVPAAGAYSLRVRGLALRPVDVRLDLPAAGRVAIAVTLDSAGVLLDAARVVAAAPAADPTGFDLRRRVGLGTFVDRAQIERLRPVYPGDLLYARPGIQVGVGGVVRMNRLGFGPMIGATRDCAPAFYVDGVLMQGQPWPAWQELRGVEAYTNLGSIPPQFSGPNAACGVVVVWTMRGSDRR